MEFLGYDSSEELEKTSDIKEAADNPITKTSILSKWTTAIDSDSDEDLEDNIIEESDILIEKRQSVADLLAFTIKPDFLKKNKNEEFQVQYVKNHVYDKIDEETKQKKFYNYRNGKDKEKQKPVNKGIDL